MNLVFAYHSGDAELAFESAKVIAALGSNIRHRATLCSANDTPLTDEIIRELKKSFPEVDRIVAQDGFNGWPLGPNQMFSDVAVDAYTKGEAWYFWEPDCVPMKAGWLDELYDEYKKHPCIMGSKFSNGIASDGKEMREMIVGSAIYPPNLLDLCPLLRSLNHYNMAYRESGSIPEPWDVRSRFEFLKIGRNTDLIKTYWKSVNYRKDGDKIIFYAQNPESQAIQKITCPDNTVDPNALVVHGCKDGSLHRMIIEQVERSTPLNLQKPKAKKRPSKKQNAERLAEASV